jgi:8-oxo-dGTP pyrophosphatase MutT (NUDIX family)
MVWSMIRQYFLQSLAAHEGFWKRSSLSLHDPYFFKQQEVIENMKDFVLSHQDCFERTLSCGHLTGSAFVVSEDFQEVLLTFHAKLKKWLQLGGHADGHPYLHEVALREAKEESGLEEFTFFPFLVENDRGPIPFDFDIHWISETPKEKAHFHYDVRYLLVAKKNPLGITSESLDLKWIDLENISSFTREVSVLRQVEKFKIIKILFN